MNITQNLFQTQPHTYNPPQPHTFPINLR